MKPTIDTGGRTADPIPITVDALDGFATVERTIEIRCEAGNRLTATWDGVSVATLVETMDVPSETTHLVVASDDGYHVCLDIRTAFESMLAVARDGEALDDADSPRLVGRDIKGVRTIKGVSTITPISLPREADPEDCEEFKLEG